MHGTPVLHRGTGQSGPHPSPRLAVAGVLGALLLTSLDHTIINVALPQMVREVGATSSDLQWIADAYVVVFAGVLLIGGAFGDRYGRRLALILGLAVFAAGSGVAALASGADNVILGRAIMGIGGGLIMPATLSSLIAMFDGVSRAKAVAAWTATASVGVAVGPLVGGWLLSWSSWNSVFWINVPAGALAVVAVTAGLGENRAVRAGRPDILGGALSVVAVGTLVWAIIEAPVEGWFSPPSVARLAGAALAIAAFLAWQRTATTPMLDLAAIRSARIGAASAAITLAFVALGGAMFLIAQYLQFSLGYSPLTAGAALLPAAVGLGIGSHLSARHQTHGGGLGIAAGIGTLVAGWGLVVQAVHADGVSYLPTGIGLFLLGIGLGVAVPAATETIVGRMPGEQAGVASAINDTVRELGSALGIAVFGSMVAARYSADVADAVAVTDLPAGLRETISDGIGSALIVAEGLGQGGAGLAATASEAFVDAMRFGLWAGAALTTAGAMIGLVNARRSSGLRLRTHPVTTTEGDATR